MVARPAISRIIIDGKGPNGVRQVPEQIGVREVRFIESRDEERAHGHVRAVGRGEGPCKSVDSPAARI